MNKTTIPLIALLLAASLQAISQEKFTLVYKMEKGKVYRYVSENSYSATQEMMGNEMTVTGDSRSIIRYETEDVAASGNLTMIVSLEESSVHTNMMGRDTTIKTTDLLGKKVRQEFSPAGKVLSQIKLDSTGGKGAGLSGRMLGDNDLILLPDKPVAVGEKWTVAGADTTKSEGNETITTYSSDYELVGKEVKNGHECLKLTYKKIYEITGKLQQMGMDMFMEGEGDAAGTYWFDVIQGLLIADESTVNQDITMAITGQTQMTIPSSQVIKMSNHLIE
jgi:hypothetical protein